MKIKQIPSDFVVWEINSSSFSEDSHYTIYQLTKTGIGTIEALNIIARSWRIKRTFLSAGGLKDRHAQTEQLISIYRGPCQNFQHQLFSLKFSGKSDVPIRPDSFEANRFTICVRDLDKTETGKIKDRLGEVKKYGLPNYFDEQRFGSVRGGNEFIAKQLVRRDFEGALKNALTATSREDRRTVKEIRQIIRHNWGNWTKCMELLPRSSERSIINYLRDHPTGSAGSPQANFSRAFELLDPNLALLYLHAYQSYLWNKALVQYLMRNAEFGMRNTGNREITNSVSRIPQSSFIKVPYLLGEFIFYHALPPDILTRLKKLSIPFVTHRTTFSNEQIKSVYEELLQKEGLELKDFRIRGMQKTYFRKGERAAVVFPGDLLVKNAEPDELNRGKLKLTLEFTLPRGSYATILIKRLSYDF